MLSVVVFSKLFFTEIKLHAPALLPDDYCPDVHERLILYKRLANARDSVELSGSGIVPPECTCVQLVLWRRVVA